MRSARVVIGANFGDEGKGLAVDALAARLDRPLVVRFNGGGQAGHTVVDPTGRRHVFSHVGAAALQGVPNFLSRFFVVHPGVFRREMAELAALGVVPEVLVDPDAVVTTPFDVVVNQWLEAARGAGRHGSVGLGFGETIERSTRGFPLLVRDLAWLDERLGAIRHGWFPARLGELGLAIDEGRAADLEARLAAFRDDVRAFLDLTRTRSIDLAAARRDLVFEGAQGLLLDQDRGHVFPHVTRSNTGLKNVLSLAGDLGLEHLEVVYMTRAYLTRHGAGPLPNERDIAGHVTVVDPTNRPNAWQGSLRLAPLDLDLMARAVAADLGDAAGRIAVTAGLGLTCLDQLGPRVEIATGGAVVEIAAAELPRRVAGALGLPLRLAAIGPARGDVHFRAGPARAPAPSLVAAA